MSGIVFYATEALEPLVEFYTETIGATVWREQPDCTILQYDNLLFGFCARDRTDRCGIITFVTEDEAGVDKLHQRLADQTTEEPHYNEKYGIYQFFVTDPDGRTVECQAFLD